MTDRCAQLLAKARANSASLRFEEACRLAECWGFELRRTSGSGGSHRVFKRPQFLHMLNLQRKHDGKAKSYQVEQLLSCIEEIEAADE